MKGDIAFAGFMLTAEEWRQLDAQSRAQLIAVATRRADSWLSEPLRAPAPRAEGSGPHDLDEQWFEVEPDPE